MPLRRWRVIATTAIDIIKNRVEYHTAPQILASINRAARRVRDASVASSVEGEQQRCAREHHGISGPKGAAPKQRTKELAGDERCIDQKKGSMINP